MPVLPSRQLRQRPPAMLKGTETRSPTFKNSTSLPFSMISPVISCPRTIPAGAVVRPRTICWSLPQMLVLISLRITPCSHLRDPSANLGKSMDWTSTLPGPAYTTPRLFAIYVHSNRNELKRHCAGLCHSMILFSGAAADSYCADNLPIAFQRDAASEDHDAAVIGNVNSEELATRLRVLRQVLG